MIFFGRPIYGIENQINALKVVSAPFHVSAGIFWN